MEGRRKKNNVIRCFKKWRTQAAAAGYKTRGKQTNKQDENRREGEKTKQVNKNKPEKSRFQENAPVLQNVTKVYKSDSR